MTEQFHQWLYDATGTGGILALAAISMITMFWVYDAWYSLYMDWQRRPPPFTKNVRFIIHLTFIIAALSLGGDVAERVSFLIDLKKQAGVHHEQSH